MYLKIPREQDIQDILEITSYNIAVERPHLNQRLWDSICYLIYMEIDCKQTISRWFLIFLEGEMLNHTEIHDIVEREKKERDIIKKKFDEKAVQHSVSP